MIKRSIHELVAAVARHASDYFEPVLKKVAVAVFSGLTEKDSSVVRAGWSAVLHLVKYVPGCWAAVDPRKSVWPHVWTMLKSGAVGNSDAVFGSMAPFLNFVPDEVVGEGPAFHRALFGALWEGLTTARGTKETKAKLYAHVMSAISAMIRRSPSAAALAAVESPTDLTSLEYCVEWVIVASCNGVALVGVTAAVDPMVQLIRALPSLAAAETFWARLGGFIAQVLITWDIPTSFPNSDVKIEAAADASPDTTSSSEVLSTWVSCIVATTLASAGSEAQVATLISGLVPQLLQAKTQTSLALIVALLRSGSAVPVFGTGGDAESTVSTLLDSAFLPLLEATQKPQTDPAAATEATVIAASIRLVYGAGCNGASSTVIAQAMGSILSTCLSTTGITAFLDEAAEVDALPATEWKTDAVRTTIFGKAMEVVKALPNADAAQQRQFLRVLTVPLTAGVTKAYVTSAQHTEILGALSTALAALGGKLSPEGAKCVAAYFPEVYEQAVASGEGTCAEVRAVIGALARAGCSLTTTASGSRPVEVAALGLVGMFKAKADTNGLAAATAAIAADIGAIVQGRGSVLRSADNSTTMAALMDTVANTISSVTAAFGYADACLTASMLPVQELPRMRRTLFNTVPFDARYLVENQVNCTAGWSMVSSAGPAHPNTTLPAADKPAVFTWVAHVLYLIKLVSSSDLVELSAAGKAIHGETLAELLLVHAVIPHAKAGFANVIGGHKLCFELEKKMASFIAVCTQMVSDEAIATACWTALTSAMSTASSVDMNTASSFYVLASLLDDAPLNAFFEHLLSLAREDDTRNVACQILQYLLIEGYVPGPVSRKLAQLVADEPFVTTEQIPFITLKVSALCALHGTAQCKTVGGTAAAAAAAAVDVADGAAAIPAADPAPDTSGMKESEMRAESARARLAMLTSSEASSSAMSITKPLMAQLQNLDEAGDEGLTVDLGDKDSLDPEDWPKALSISTDAAKVFRMALLHGCYDLSADDWDFILCTTLAWLETEPASIPEHVLVASAGAVAASVDKQFAAVETARSQGVGPAPHSAVLATMEEWKDFFVPAMGEQILLKVLAEHKSEEWEALQETLARAVLLVPVDVSLAHAEPGRVLSLFAATGSKATSLACHHLLVHHIQKFGKCEEDIEDEAEIPWKVCSLFQATAAKQTTELDIWKLCLATLAFCSLFEAATITGKAALAAKIRKTKATVTMLNFCADGLDGYGALVPNLGAIITNSFRACHDFVDGVADEGKLNVLLCHTFYRIVVAMPVLARDWFQDLGRRVREDVADFTSRHISPTLIRSELRTVVANTEKDENMVIAVRAKAAEVVGTYSMEGMTMELVISFDDSHPLQPVKVSCGRRIGVQAAQWRNWLLQMITFMSNQNGTILDGFKIWKKNVDKRFDGLEDCTICYAVIHPVSYTLPDKRCKTCKNAFHSACLFKWFNTSQQSTCPLCRNLWMG